MPGGWFPLFDFPSGWDFDFGGAISALFQACDAFRERWATLL
jgi:hypothetical protein